MYYSRIGFHHESRFWNERKRAPRPSSPHNTLLPFPSVSLLVSHCAVLLYLGIYFRIPVLVSVRIFGVPIVCDGTYTQCRFGKRKDKSENTGGSHYTVRCRSGTVAWPFVRAERGWEIKRLRANNGNLFDQIPPPRRRHTGPRLRLWPQSSTIVCRRAVHHRPAAELAESAPFKHSGNAPQDRRFGTSFPKLLRHVSFLFCSDSFYLLLLKRCERTTRLETDFSPAVQTCPRVNRIFMYFLSTRCG